MSFHKTLHNEGTGGDSYVASILMFVLAMALVHYCVNFRINKEHEIFDSDMATIQIIKGSDGVSA